MLLLGLALAYLPLASSPEAEGVSSPKVMEWIDACEREISYLHGFVFLRHGKVIAEGSWKPYDTLNEPHFLSSHTKCFTGAAVGFLVDEGRLDLDDRVIDFVPDKAPAHPSARLQGLRIRDLLTMNTGFKDDGWYPDHIDGDWAKAFLANEFATDPGRQYRYSSAGTHVLGMIVARRAGKPYMEFLKERLFDPLGIDRFWTTVDTEGNPCTGWGFYLTTREIALMGQLHLQKGVWNGRRLLSENWVTLATSKQTWSGKTPKEFRPKNDWLYGFGFNWWQCQHGCYRADGAGGQYTIVFPQHDAVLSINSDVNDMQQILDIVWDRFLPVFAPAALPENAAAATALRARCAKLEIAPVKGRREGLREEFLGREFEFVKLPPDIQMHGVRLDPSADGWKLAVRTEAGVSELPVGFGRWQEGKLVFTNRKHQPLGMFVGPQPVLSSGAVQDDGTLKVTVLVRNSARRLEFSFHRRFFKPVVDAEMIGHGKFSM